MALFDYFFLASILFAVTFPWFGKRFFSILKNYLLLIFLFSRRFVQDLTKFGTIRKWQGGNRNGQRSRNNK